jgi:hypothetical protein
MGKPFLIIKIDVDKTLKYIAKYLVMVLLPVIISGLFFYFGDNILHYFCGCISAGLVVLDILVIHDKIIFVDTPGGLA